MDSPAWKSLSDLSLSDFKFKLLKPKAPLIKGRCFKKFNDEEFNKDLQLVPFHAA